MRTELPKSFEETVALLKEYGAVEEGHFILASGRHSPYYVKKGRLVQHPWELQGMIEQTVPELTQLGGIDVVLSPAVGGIPVGQQVGLALHARTIYAERSGFTNELELKRGFEIRRGERVLLVEDVITTGGTLKELYQFVEAEGGVIAGIFVLVNRSKSSHLDSRRIVSCMTVDFPTYSPEEIPSSLATIPAIRPGTKRVE